MQDRDAESLVTARVRFAAIVGAAAGTLAIMLYARLHPDLGATYMKALIVEVPLLACASGIILSVSVGLADDLAVRRNASRTRYLIAGGALAGPIPALIGTIRFGSMSIPWPGTPLGLALGLGFLAIAFHFALARGGTPARALVGALAPAPLALVPALVVRGFRPLEFRSSAARVLDELDLSRSAQLVLAAIGVFVAGLAAGAIAGGWIAFAVHLGAPRAEPNASESR